MESFDYRRIADCDDGGIPFVIETAFGWLGEKAEDERRLVRAHVHFGYSLLEGLGVEPVDTWVLHHHEHWDGTGYPDGLRGSTIPLPARIVAVCDAFDAMTDGRDQTDSASVAEAVDELRSAAGTLYDPCIVEPFCDLMETRVGEYAKRA